MSEIRLYKKFYCVNLIKTGATIDERFTLIEPFSLSANTYTASSGDTETATIIEPNLLITEEIFGVYYANLNPTFYASDVTYELVWFVGYTNSAPIKKINTRFRINANRLTNQIEIEYLNAPIEIELVNSPLEIDILGKY